MVDMLNQNNFKIENQIKFLLNLRQDIRLLLNAHPKGIWFRMLPNVYHAHFNRQLEFDLLSINNIYSLLDYISDIIKFDLPKNITEDDFVIELKENSESTLTKSIRIVDLEFRRDLLLKTLQNVNNEKRPSRLREICIIDEYVICSQENFEKAPTNEEITLRLQKLRSMLDFYIGYRCRTTNDLSDKELIQLYESSNEYIAQLEPFIKRLYQS